MLRRFLALLFLLSCNPLFADELYVACYNVENLFDPGNRAMGEDDPAFTPSGDKQWTESRLKRKIENLAGVIKKMNDNKGPDVLGLCEIENRHVVELLAQAITMNGRNYKVVHQDSPSKRGIDCAIIFDGAKLQLHSSAFYAVPPIETRDVVEAEFEMHAKKLTVFMNHWPSQAHPPTDREIVAKKLRHRIEQLLAADHQADILVMGDLNDKPEADSIKVHLKVTNDQAALSPGIFLNTMAPIAQLPNRGTYVFRNQWETIDHIIISPGLLNPDGFKWKANSTTEIKFAEQIYTPTTAGNIPRPNRTYTSNQFHEKGISDHLPVGCVLEIRQ